jgi:gamma-aminobutyric acid type B receptor
MSHHVPQRHVIEQIRDGSGVIRVDSSKRVIHLAAILPVTRPERTIERYPLHSRVFYIYGGFLAFKHFNERSNLIIPDLSKRLEGCDIQMSLEYRDTQYQRAVSARQLQEALSAWPQNSLERPIPSALVGAGRSDVSETISALSGIYQIPQISPHSSAASLDDKTRFPLFARTTPSNSADSAAAVEYFKHLEVSHVGVIFTLDANGKGYFESIQREAKEKGISVVSAAYKHDGAEEDIRQSLRSIKLSEVRYIFAAIEPATWKDFIRLAIEEEIIDRREYVWIFHSGMVGLVPEILREDEYDIARAIHGSAVLLKDFAPNPELDAKIFELQNNTELQEEFLSHYVEREIFEDFDFRYPGPNYPQYINYDSIMSIGLAACSIDKEFFTGQELYNSLLQTEYEGASGYVSFFNHTGSRKSVPFQVDNIFMVSKEDGYGFVQVPVAKVDHGVEVLRDFVFWDNTTNMPLTLPELEQDLNLISNGTLIFGWILCAITMTASIGWCFWVCLHRNDSVVKASQPFFLIQICLGTLLMASSIIPMSLQEPLSQSGLSHACMSIPWLLTIGYSISFSAIFSKTWRIKQIFKAGRSCRRADVKISEAIFPLLIFGGINVILLTCWTTISPLEWMREDLANYDRFARSRESSGRCQSEDSTVSLTISILIAAVSFLALVFTNYQCYLARDIPTDFNESLYVGITNVSLLEALILGAPILVLANEEPTKRFAVRSFMVTVFCFCILLPIFVPKQFRRLKQSQDPTNFLRASVASMSIKNQSHSFSFGLGEGGSTRLRRSPDNTRR